MPPLITPPPALVAAKVALGKQVFGCATLACPAIFTPSSDVIKSVNCALKLATTEEVTVPVYVPLKLPAPPPPLLLPPPPQADKNAAKHINGK